MTIRINSRALWLSALRGLGWGFLRFELVFIGGFALALALGESWAGVVAAVLFAIAAWALPTAVIIESALQASRPPSGAWAQVAILYGVATPGLMLVILWLAESWGSTPQSVYLWAIPILCMAASGLALASLRGARSGEDDTRLALPAWRIAVGAVAGLLLGALIYLPVYCGWLAPPAREEDLAAYVGMSLFFIPQLLLGTTVGCYAVALMWRLSGPRESEAEVSP